MSFSKNDLDAIKLKTSIRHELEKKTKVIQKGKDFWCCCPFHDEKTPSCKINEDSGSFYCFGCGAKGDIFTIYTDLYNYKFIDAVKELSKQAGVDINFDDFVKGKQDNKIEEILELTCLWFQENLNNSYAGTCNEYLKKRKLSKETISKFRLGYSSNSNQTLYEFLKNKNFNDDDLLASNIIKIDKNKKIRDYFYRRLIFPIMNIQGKVVGFGGRSLDDSNPKYINSPESKIFQKRNLLYNLNIAKDFARKKNNLLICEGYMDVISLNQNGILSVVAPLGTALTEDQLKLSWNYSSKPTIMFDGDSAGLRASFKAAIMSLQLITSNKFLQFVTLPKGYDPDNFVNELSISELIKKLKSPLSLSNFIFRQSVKSASLDKVDEKISYDKYLDDLIETIKDSKIKYFYKNEFKSLFFEKIREIGKKNIIKKNTSKKIEINLNQKQKLSFFAAAINHFDVRKMILEELLISHIIDENELSFVKELTKEEILVLNKDKILKKYTSGLFEKILKESMTGQIYELFPYSSGLYDPQKALEDIRKSLKNLNTRLSNLQKINKSLDTFVNDSNQLNWSDLQSINIEILDED